MMNIGKVMIMKMRNRGISRLLEKGMLMPYHFCLYSRAVFSGVVEEVLVNLMLTEAALPQSSTSPTISSHPTWWVYGWTWICINTSVSSTRSILGLVPTSQSSVFPEQTARALSLKRGHLMPSPIPKRNSWYIFFPSKVDIHTRIRNIFSETFLINIHPEIIVYDQSISNVTGQNSYKSIPKMAKLILPFRFHQKIWKRKMGVSYSLKTVMHKGGEVWCHVELV